jgi:hypothetical protein
MEAEWASEKGPYTEYEQGRRKRPRLCEFRLDVKPDALAVLQKETFRVQP